MAIVISHMSALDFWRTAYPASKAPDSRRCAHLRERICCSEEDAWTFAPPAFTARLVAPESGVLHLTVRSRNERKRSSAHRCHLWEGEFPKGALYRLSNDAYITSPPFTFLQMAQTLSLAQLIALGDELCGTYSFDASAENGMRQRGVPLAEVASLTQFMNAVSITAADRGKFVRGARKAQTALAHVVERSASPRETMLEMLLTLPCNKGGYALPQPEMNREIRLNREAAAMAGRRTLRADLFWKTAHLDVEFNGTQTHSGAGALFSDLSRRNALELMGFTVKELTWRQLDNAALFESMALSIARIVGKRIRSQQRGLLPQRIALRDELFAWNRNSGRPRKQ